MSTLAAPFPDGSFVSLTTNLTGVSTWPGYRRPALIVDMEVQGNRVAFAGHDLGALVLDRDSGAVLRRYLSPTIGSTGHDVALAGNLCLMSDNVSNPEAHWFGLGTPFPGSGTLEEEIGFGVAGLGELGLSWTMGSRRTNTFIRTYDATLPTGPMVTGEWEIVHGFNDSPPDVQLCSVNGWPLAVVRRKASTSNSERHWLEVLSLDPSRTVQSAQLDLPRTDNRLRVASDGRLLLAGFQSSEDWIRLYQVELEGASASFRLLSETGVPDQDGSPPALGRNLMASVVTHPGDDAVVLHDISDPTAPVRLATLPLPVQNRLGNPAQLAIEGDRLVFSDYHGAYWEADLADPAAPRWIKEALLTGQTDSLTHNGPWVLASEGLSDSVRLLDLGSDAAEPREIATVVLEGNVESVVWVGHIAYVLEASGGASLVAMDFGSPGRPRISRLPLRGSILSDYSLASDGTALVVREGDKRFSALHVHTLEVPGHPRLVARIASESSGGSFRGIAVRDGFAYAAFAPLSGSSRLMVFDVQDPAAPKEVASVDVPLGDSENTLHLEGGRLRIVTYRFQHWLHQVHEIDVSDPAHPVLLGTAEGAADPSQGEYSVPVGDLILRTITDDGPTPWGDAFHSILRADDLTRTDSGLMFGEKRAEMLVRRHSVVTAGTTRTVLGRRASLNTPHRLGDLVLLPVGLHGFDVVRADFLPAPAPTLVHPPVGRRAAVGRRAVLSATVDGALPLTMQWFKGEQPLVNGDRIAGADSTALVLDPVSLEDAGEYRLRVTNPAGEVTSQPVALTVGEARPLRLELASAGGSNWKATVSGDPDQVVELEQSDDLESWTPAELASGVVRAWLTGTDEEVSLGAVPASARYYRAAVVYAP